MPAKTQAIHFKVINSCLGYLCLLVICTNFSHQTVPVWSWVNYCLYFLMSVLCLFIFRYEKANKAIFFNIGLLCFFYGMSFVNLFVGDGYLLGNDFLSFYVFQYRTILLSVLLGFAVVYVCIRYIFFELHVGYAYLITGACVMPLLFWCYAPFLLDKNYLLNLPNNLELYRSVLHFTLFSLLAVCVYGFCLYRNERSLGEHVNTVMVYFFVMTTLELTDAAGTVYGIKLFSISQYILLIILSLFIVTLYRKLVYNCSDFAQFYERLIVSGNSYGVPIRRRESALTQRFLILSGQYFHHRKNTLGLAVLGFAMTMNYLQISSYLKLNLVVVFSAFLILSGYALALFNKRTANGNLLSFKRTTRQ